MGQITGQMSQYKLYLDNANKNIRLQYYYKDMLYLVGDSFIAVPKIN
jgi:hypothetical protein